MTDAITIIYWLLIIILIGVIVLLAITAYEATTTPSIPMDFITPYERIN